MTEDTSDLFSLMEKEFSITIVSKIQELLENKHLYQYVNVEFPPFKNIHQNFPDSSDITSVKLEKCRVIYKNANNFEWCVQSRLFLNPGYAIPHSGIIPYKGQIEATEHRIQFIPPNIKIFCSTCKNVYPFNFIHGIDFFGDLRITKTEPNDNIQFFTFSYECQGCNGTPEVFLIRREGMRLTLSGRSPMEYVEVPKFIPKDQRKYISDAKVAFNSGQVLAAKFLLRTFIEQYVRNFTQDFTSQDTEKLFREYTKILPDDFKDRFPSLSNIYERLSSDIHKADNDPDLFHRAQEDIIEHFDARRLYKIPFSNNSK